MGARIDAVKNWKDDKLDSVLNRTRANYHAQWMEVCGVDTVDEIDYENPFVKIEWLLCDPGWLHAIKSEQGRQEFKERLNDPLAWWIFTSYRDEENGSGYWDLTQNTIVHQVRTKYRHFRTRKNGKTTRQCSNNNETM